MGTEDRNGDGGARDRALNAAEERARAVSGALRLSERTGSASRGIGADMK